jgi:hypothetical protein
MDKKIAALLGAVASVSTLGAAQAATPVNPGDALQASSYADLLAPVPNAVAALIADDAARASKSDGEMEVAQIQVQIGHHHHHHHRYHRKPVIVIKRHHRRHHHHHHHRYHHHSQYMAFPKAPV